VTSQALETLICLSLNGDESAQWTIREHLVNAMLGATAANAHVRRQMQRLGLTKRMESALPDLLSRTDLGARIVDRISDVGWDPKHLDKVLLLVKQGFSAEEAIEKVARWTLRHVVDQEDSLVFVRKAIERGVRLASRAGEIEEIVAVGFKISDEVESLVRETVALKLIGPPIRSQKLRDLVVVFTAMAKTSKGRQFDIVFRRPFIGSPGHVSDVVRNASDPWRDLSRPRRSRDEVRQIAREQIRPLAPKSRKGRGTVSEIVSIPAKEVKRIAQELARRLGRPIDRALFFSGLYATLYQCNLETLARFNDPTNLFGRRQLEGADRGDTEPDS
jgi:hypothetical protein